MIFLKKQILLMEHTRNSVQMDKIRQLIYLRFKKRDNINWTAPNQISTYELVNIICYALEETRDTRNYCINKIYGTVKTDPIKYGIYAGNNSWSPIFTDDQLINFINLVKETVYQ